MIRAERPRMRLLFIRFSFRFPPRGERLAGLPNELHEAADAIASFEVWERLRREQKLGRERAARVVESALLAFLGHR